MHTLHALVLNLGSKHLVIFLEDFTDYFSEKRDVQEAAFKIPVCDRHDDSAANSFSVMALTNDVRGVKRMCKVTLTTNDTAQPAGAGRRIDRRQQLLTFDLHFGHASHISVWVGGVAGVLSRWLRAHRVQRQDSILVNTVWQTHNDKRISSAVTETGRDSSPSVARSALFAP